MSRLKPIYRIAVLFVFIAVSLAAFGAEGEYTFQENVMIPMRDGVKLAANIFLPKGDGPFPTILTRSPYGKSDENYGDGKRYAGHGYALVIQDCRGKGDSEGLWDPFRYDKHDGFDTQEWVGKQSWCNGKIGTAGGSYVGFTQWISAPEGSQYLKTMVPLVPPTEIYDVAYVGGAYQLALLMGWGTGVAKISVDKGKIDWGKAFLNLPLKTWDTAIGEEIFYLRDWIAHPTYDDYWEKRGIPDGFKDVTVPVLNIGGWYDIFAKATLEQVTRVRHQSTNRQVRRNQYVILGPWTHGISRDGKVGEMDFGKQSYQDVGDIQFKWMEYWLKEKETGVEDWPPYSLFVMGENKWRGENEWPLKRTNFTNYYLHSQGKANSKSGDGVLKDSPSHSEKTDTFEYDPNNPVPSHGGNNLVGATAGPYDQSKIEDREDVLVYTSDELKEPLEVTGPIQLVLYASSTAKDTDFTGKLIDVHPDGRAINLCEGIIRARFRKSNTELSLIEPGKIVRYEIDLWVTSNVFLPGHRVRLEVSSSNFPRFDRNPNSGKPFGSDTEVLKATQTIYHDDKHPSHLVLPVIPR